MTMPLIHTQSPRPRCREAAPRWDRRPRRGAVLIAMLVLLAVFMTLASGWVRRVVAERQAVRRDWTAAQAARLAESGLDRARGQLAKSAEYRGETWEIPAESWEADRDASVQITVKADDPGSGLTEITARATFPKGDDRTVHRTRTALVRLLPSKP